MAVVPMIVETTGGVAPHSRRHCGLLTHRPAATGRTRGKGAVDRMRYGSTHISPKSYFVHHTQRITKAAVMHEVRLGADAR